MASHSSRRSRRSRRERGTRLRTKVVALLMSLAALWAFAAFVTLREGLNLVWVTTLTEHVGRPTEALLAELQHERRLSVVFLSTTHADRADLDAQRVRTDDVLAAFKRHRAASSVSWAASDALQTRLRELSTLLDGLPGLRTGIDDRSAIGVVTGYSAIIDGGFRVYGSISALDDPDIAKQSRTLVALSRARETLSQEDALLAGALATGRFTGTEHAEFAQLVGAQRFAYAEAAAELPSPEREQYEQLAASSTLANLRTIEDRVIEAGRTGAAPPVDAAAWASATEAAAGDLRALELASAELTLQRAKPAAIGVIVRLLLAGGLGLIAVIASIVISITTARALVRQLVRLRDAAHQLAHERLPNVVEKLRRGDTVDVPAEAPPLEFGPDEIGQVGRAFNAVQETAIRAAVDQAELRKSVRDVFVSLARRTQTLVHRQLKLLDTMERHETNADELAVLFRVDHLATRMRRNAENLIVLSGAAPGRGWRQPVPMIDVLRGAAAEIEDYTRVTVLPVAPVGLTGRVVGDVIHLLAELLENAAIFSPPHTLVQLGGQLVANGFAVEVEDRGLGMSETTLALANDQLRRPPEFHLSSTARLGLYVVGRLAERHGIRVHLRSSPYGGTSAIVLIPMSLVIEQIEERPALPDRHDDGVLAPPASGAGAAPVPLVPRRNPGSWPPARRPDTAPARGNGGPALTPVSAPPVAPEAPPPDASTVFGLPRRLRTVNRTNGGPEPAPADPTPESAGPWSSPPSTSEPPQPSAPRARTPEDVRMLMRAYQSGTRRARLDAERGIPEQPQRDPSETVEP